MNHQPFEDQLFADDALPSDEQQLMKAHLEECLHCRTLAESKREIDRMLDAAMIIEPQSGFAQRWLARMELKRQAAHHRQTATLLFFLSAGAVLLALPLLLHGFLMALAPEDIFFDLIAGTARWLAWFGFLGKTSTSLTENLISRVPTVWLLVFLAAFSALIALWLISIFRFNPELRKERSN